MVEKGRNILFDYLDYPTLDESNKILETFTVLEDLHLEIIYKDKGQNGFSLLMGDMELGNWLRVFNNKRGEVCLTYIFLTHYFNKGIPDDEWAISPGKDGQSIQYFPHFEEKHFFMKYLYDYYADVFYHKLFSSLDCIYHMMNIYYEMDLVPGFGFRRKVMTKLEEKNKPLFDMFRSFAENIVFKKSIHLRNDFTHNFPPHDIDSGIRKENDGNMKRITWGIGKYTPTQEVQKNMNEMLQLLSTLLKDIKSNLEG